MSTSRIASFRVVKCHATTSEKAKYPFVAVLAFEKKIPTYDGEGKVNGYDIRDVYYRKSSSTELAEDSTIGLEIDKYDTVPMENEWTDEHGELRTSVQTWIIPSREV